jgi:hypothetical protein
MFSVDENSLKMALQLARKRSEIRSPRQLVMGLRHPIRDRWKVFRWLVGALQSALVVCKSLPHESSAMKGMKSRGKFTKADTRSAAAALWEKSACVALSLDSFELPDLYIRKAGRPQLIESAQTEHEVRAITTMKIPRVLIINCLSCCWLKMDF